MFVICIFRYEEPNKVLIRLKVQNNIFVILRKFVEFEL